jgi:serine/threonine protein kinase
MKRYEIVRLLGEGGMGRVYEAIDRKSGRSVAIKTLRSALTDATSQRLLLNEATAAFVIRALSSSWICSATTTAHRIS